jgi:hypothetical protein
VLSVMSARGAAAGVAALMVLTPAAAQAKTRVNCRGGSSACTARVSLAGGASNERVVIRLPSRGLRLVSVRPSDPSLRGAYSLSDQRERAGGREYVVTLSAVQSIPSGAYLAFTFRASGGGRAQIVRCRGGSFACTALVSLAGGASNRRVVIQLSDTDLRLVSVAPNHPSLRGAYSLTDQHLRSGGSEYVVTLNAVQSIPAGSDLIFQFES